MTRAFLEAIHFDLIREHGGTAGIRDETLLESALARPCQKFSYGRRVDLPGLAAAYGYGLSRNHPFVDGNKRVSLMAIYAFLFINGLELTATESQAVDIMTGVASGSVDEAALAHWIRSNVAVHPKS